MKITLAEVRNVCDKKNKRSIKISSWFFHKQCERQVKRAARRGDYKATCIYFGEFYDVPFEESLYWESKGFETSVDTCYRYNELGCSALEIRW